MCIREEGYGLKAYVFLDVVGEDSVGYSVETLRRGSGYKVLKTLTTMLVDGYTEEEEEEGIS